MKAIMKFFLSNKSCMCVYHADAKPLLITVTIVTNHTLAIKFDSMYER